MNTKFLDMIKTVKHPGVTANEFESAAMMRVILASQEITALPKKNVILCDPAYLQMLSQHEKRCKYCQCKVSSTDKFCEQCGAPT